MRATAVCACGQSEVFRPPAGTTAAAANAALQAAFPEMGEISEVVIYATTTGPTVLTPSLEAFTNAINRTVRAFAPGFVAGLEGYYTARALDLLPEVSAKFVSADNKTSIIVIDLNCGVTDPEGVRICSACVVVPSHTRVARGMCVSVWVCRTDTCPYGHYP